MLLPSALPCDFLAPSLAALPRPVPIAPSPPYHSPPHEETRLASATTTVLQTCRRLQQMLSGDRSSPAPISLALASQRSGVRKPTTATRRITAAPSDHPRTPLRRGCTNTSRLPPPPLPLKMPARRRLNKRTRSAAFPLMSSPTSDSSSSPSNKEYNRAARFTTPPPRNKRPRLSTPPPAPNRGFPQRRVVVDSDDEMEEVQWTDDDDRQLVEMVLGKLQLSKSDWEECARTLGKGDSRSVGKRWEDLLGNIAIKNRRKRIGRVARS